LGKNKAKDKDKDNDTTTAASKEEDIESWAAIIEDLGDLDEYDKVSVLDLDEDDVSWTSKDISNEESLTDYTINLDEEDYDADNEFWAIIEELSDDEDLASLEEMPELTTMISSNDATKEAELYNLEVSQHISPFRQCFITYCAISPCPITTADKRTFYAVGIGDLRIEVPNGPRSTQILLKDTLHAPDIGLTVVSIGWITSSGHSVAFKGNKCQIKNQNDVIIGRIPISVNRIYKVQHKYANVTMLEHVDILMLHRHLGHISADTI
jgi:hypothetical protein